ncbi:hypothetical protein Phum_PHUM586270 [Pediculus humanus corporis]|uniref:Uncharacterized protein n=1 Tax=Pediculus humanus subsp. corporis TaxID=121224 RepID=E0W283_PEDHC|nr:uncharacterized protein Phum_PHUM586270 [Pediculus humanus corporis]EEB19739.1 hypothetical protein Phum_PHUM586270 [Pediculus humanus corporis]
MVIDSPIIIVLPKCTTIGSIRLPIRSGRSTETKHADEFNNQCNNPLLDRSHKIENQKNLFAQKESRMV